jgi:P-type Ca2+ transporter type 2C
VPHVCRVVRDGERREVPVVELVPGDVLALEAGDAVPADARVVEAHEFAVNNAALTGESEPLARVPDAVAARTAPMDARNFVLMGTSVVAGTGKAVVFVTGAATEFGRICALAQQAPASKTPLQRQVATMARFVSAGALTIGAAMFLIRPTGTSVVCCGVARSRTSSPVNRSVEVARRSGAQDPP